MSTVAGRIQRFLRAAKIARTKEFKDLWFEQGRTWAEQEPLSAAASQLADIAAGYASYPFRETLIAAKLRHRWERAMADQDYPYGWGAMGDRLPDSALAAFAEGVLSSRRKPQ